MPIPSSAADLSTTADSNSPAGSDSVGTSLDDYLRAIQAIIKQQDSKGSDIASSTTIDIPNSGRYFIVTGTTTIAGISDDWLGRIVVLKFSGILQLTNSSSFILPTAANITTAAGDCMMVTNESTGVWRVIAYHRANGAALFGVLTNVSQTFTEPQLFADGFLVNGAAEMGYGNGSGGSVTQQTSRTTSVTLNKPTGRVIMFSAAGVTTYNSFTFNNSFVSQTDTVILNLWGNTNYYDVDASPFNGGFVVNFKAASTSVDQPIINFSVIKAVIT